ncbi:MAG: DUF2889 domain-containing protein [Novosphingobium sp.]
MTFAPADRLPGYRRKLHVEAGAGAVVAQMEDDYHCMSVTLEHDGGRVTSVIPDMNRAPWTTCPGALAKLVVTFSGQLLADVTARREKKQSCTHLHDLAVLAAAHAGTAGGLTYDIYASDPVDGERILEIRRNGKTAMHWVEQDGVLVSPEGIAGLTLMTLRDWIASLPEDEREAARLLQWAAIVAHGRTLPWERMHLTDNMPPSCYTFQPERIASASRVGTIIDFSAAGKVPLNSYGSAEISRVQQGLRRR